MSIKQHKHWEPPNHRGLPVFISVGDVGGGAGDLAYLVGERLAWREAADGVLQAFGVGRLVALGIHGLLLGDPEDEVVLVVELPGAVDDGLDTLGVLGVALVAAVGMEYLDALGVFRGLATLVACLDEVPLAQQVEVPGGLLGNGVLGFLNPFLFVLGTVIAVLLAACDEAGEHQEIEYLFHCLWCLRL